MAPKIKEAKFFTKALNIFNMIENMVAERHVVL